MYLNSFREKEFHHLRVLIDNGDGQGRPAEGIEAVDVEEVILVLEGLDQFGHAGAVASLNEQNEFFLFRCENLKSRLWRSAANLAKSHFTFVRSAFGGQVVTVIVFYSDDPSSNLAEVYSSVKLFAEDGTFKNLF